MHRDKQGDAHSSDTYEGGQRVRAMEVTQNKDKGDLAASICACQFLNQLHTHTHTHTSTQHKPESEILFCEAQLNGKRSHLCLVQVRTCVYMCV